MKWSAILTLGLVLMALTGLIMWGYQFFVAPESIESVAAKWAQSGHADKNSPAFTNWDGDDPPVVPQNCAKCHSMTGYTDFLGEDGTVVGQVDGPAKTGTVHYCHTCHNPSAHKLTMVKFPSGAELEENSYAANCMQCHQGRAAAATVNKAIAGIAPDAVSPDLSFINVHYAIAAATLMGGDAQGGYQYEGQSYAGRLEHVADYRTCSQCHNPHSTAIDPNTCSPCHANVVNFGDLREIRQSPVDYDGDGDVSEPIADEIAALHTALYVALQTYAAQIAGAPIAYEEHTHPYFFIDTNANGVADPDEANRDNLYATWTPRLLRAAYNYHYVHNDPGAYTHNPHYVLQMLYDNLADLNQATPVAGFERLVRP